MPLLQFQKLQIDTFSIKLVYKQVKEQNFVCRKWNQYR